VSEVVSNLGDRDTLAAEYVLGTLDSGEHEHARSLAAADEAFAAKVKLWERRLGELHLMVEPVEPDPELWERIKAKLPELQQALPVGPAEAEAPAAPPIAGPEPPVVGPTIVPDAQPEMPVAAAPQTGSEETIDPPVEAFAEEPAVLPSEPPVARTLVAPAPGPATPVSRELSVPPPLPPWPGEREEAMIRRRLAGWRALALLTTLGIIAIAGLLAAWRWAPERVPPALQPVEVMRRVGVTLPAPKPPPRRAAPPESQFDE
jgi:hypothetical protein